ncbi:MAG: histidinol-phosphatase HisJ family protein, partial [Lentisphaeria bacterium]|nr:histidinol-phosphatase HisJ family protein [Lentisphaeria bacterium]
MFASYHNHSTWSDGKASIREMAQAAREAGLREFGISDHFVYGPPEVQEDANTWTMPVENLRAYIEDASAVKAEFDCDEFHFRIGAEVDYFDETWETVNRYIASMPLDYVIGAVHYSRAFPIDKSADLWRALAPEERDDVWREYLRKLKLCVERMPCNFLAHPDLPKIFAVGKMPEDCRDEFHTLFTMCAERNVAIEINTAGLDKLCAELYPARELPEDAVKLGEGILVGGDAQCTEQDVRHFDDA